jgi:hypothetical protein
MRSQTRLTEASDEEKEDQEIRELEIVRNHPQGRPLFLTPRRFVRICKHIERGESITDSCHFEAVNYPAFRMHLKRNPQFQKRLRQAEETREEFLREFHIANIKKHAPRNVLASLWWLERRFPHQFALRNFVRANGNDEEACCDKLSPEQIEEIVAARVRLALECPKGRELPAPLTADQTTEQE